MASNYDEVLRESGHGLKGHHRRGQKRPPCL